MWTCRLGHPHRQWQCWGPFEIQDRARSGKGRGWVAFVLHGATHLLSRPSPPTSTLPVLCPVPLRMALSWAAGSWLVALPSTWGPPVVQPWTPVSQPLLPYSNTMPSLCLPLSTWSPLPHPQVYFLQEAQRASALEMGPRDLGNGCSGLDTSDPASPRQRKLEAGQPGMQLVQGEVGVRMPCWGSRCLP